MTPGAGRTALAASLLVLMAACFVSLALGVRSFGPGAIWAALAGREPDGLAATILRGSRLPRMVTGLTVGAGLGLAGAILQTVTRNLLADPGLLGINAGAAFAVVLAVSLSASPPSLAMTGPVAAAGAAATGVMVHLLAGGTAALGSRPLRLLLSGGVMAMFLGALTGIVLILSPGALEATQVWLAGSVADRSGAMLRLYAPAAGLLVLAGLALAPGLSVLMVGDAQGRALGADVARLRLWSLAVAAGLCGVSVSLAGPLAFVGLIAPHVARRLGGPRPTSLFALSAIHGAALVLLADTVARLAVAPSELPVGVVIAALGVPFYLFLLRRPSVGEA